MTSDIIPEPSKRVKLGLVKVLTIFLSGVMIGGYIGKNISRKLDDYHLFSIDDNEDPFEDWQYLNQGCEAA